MPDTVDDGNVRWAGPLGDLQLPQAPAPERALPEYVHMAGGIDREPKPAPQDSGLQPRTENLPEGQIGDVKLSMP